MKRGSVLLLPKHLFRSRHLIPTIVELLAEDVGGCTYAIGCKSEAVSQSLLQLLAHTYSLKQLPSGAKILQTPFKFAFETSGSAV